jgi:hypothetical protein
MARNKKRKTCAQERVLESIFGIELEGVSGDHASPAPQPDPAAATDIEAQAEAIAQKHERAAHMAEIRAAAVDVAKTAGVKQGRAHAFVKLLDLSGVAVDSAGEPDTAEIARLVRAGTEEYPELTTAGESLYGAVPGGRGIPNV